MPKKTARGQQRSARTGVKSRKPKGGRVEGRTVESVIIDAQTGKRKVEKIFIPR